MWILTSSYNDYNQHGEYFEAAWREKPSREQICIALGWRDGPWVDHLLAGGGRQGYQEVWYELFEYEETK